MQSQSKGKSLTCLSSITGYKLGPSPNVGFGFWPVMREAGAAPLAWHQAWLLGLWGASELASWARGGTRPVWQLRGTQRSGA